MTAEQREHQQLVKKTNSLIRKIRKHIMGLNPSAGDLNRLKAAVDLTMKENIAKNQDGINKILEILIEKYGM